MEDWVEMRGGEKFSFENTAELAAVPNHTVT